MERLAPSLVVRVNRAVAVAEVDGPEVALSLLDEVDAAGDRWHLYWSTKAEMLARLGRTAEAVDSFQRALGCSPNDSDRRHLQRRVAELSGR